MDIKTEALNYIRERYNEEQRRFHHFEEKCSKLVGLLTFMLSGTSVIITILGKDKIPPNGTFEWLTLILLGCALFLMFCAWGHAMLALKIGDCPQASRSRENAYFIFNAQEADALDQIYECYVNSTQELFSFIQDKAKNLKYTFEEMFIAAAILFLTLAIHLIGLLSK